jgi:type III restriction enzyme
MFELKPFQDKAVTELLKQSRGLLTTDGLNKKCVFKAPTGSGKTIMMADLLQRFSSEDWVKNYVFVWTSLYDLHTQSKAKLAAYLENSHYNLISLDEIGQDSLPDDTVLFVNWHSLTTQKLNEATNEREWANSFVKDREDGRSIVSVLEKTRDEGKQVVLIVDEAHRNYLTENSQQFTSEIFQPKLTIEVSATPLLKIDPEEIINKKAGFVSVSFSDAVSSGLIKQETVINQNVDQYLDIASSADDLVIHAAIEKLRELEAEYSNNSIQVNPLLLIQLPSEKEKTSELDRTVREEVESYLHEKGITYENGKLAVWLSEEKKNLELIEKNDSPVEVLIFKEAVAVGWDCPRAQILVMLRAIRSLTFEIQTVGRILRMPESKHYTEPSLNTAYVFTNIAGININDKPEDLDFFKTKFSALKPGLSEVKIPSAYLHRQDYGDLTATFSGILIKELNKRFGIQDSDMANDAYIKADKELELYPDELKSPILSDVIVKNLDDIVEEIGELDIEHIQADVSAANIQKEFDYLLKAWCLPYAPVRSFTKIKTALYKWFGTLGFPNSRWHEIQRIVSCSEVNQKILTEVIKSAKDLYELQRPEELSGRKEITESTYSPPPILTVGDAHEAVSLARYAYEPANLGKKRSDPEHKLEAVLDASKSVDWWLKNGEGMQQFLSIVYEYLDEQSGLHRRANFFPDFIVKFVDGTIGIYETKSGMTVTDRATYAKSDALQQYIKANAKLKLRGGIVNATPTGLMVFTKESYTPEKADWTVLAL